MQTSRTSALTFYAGLPGAADLPASVRDIIETATGRLLFLGVLKRAGAEGASDVVAFSRAWAGLSRAGYVEHPDGMWRRLPPAQRADTAALTSAVKAAARIETPRPSS